MRTANHLAGGLVITGFCSALCGVNIFSSPASIGVLAIASLLPDIDHPRSIIGRSLKPISQSINRRWGHRTITHSAVALITSTTLLATLEKAFSGSTHLTVIYFFAYFSHLLLDMVTLMGVPLLYPFSRNPFVMPANPHWRIRNDDRRAETIAFCIFILSALFMRPLFEQGFWTTYNRTFGTLKHVVSEFHKADDLLEVSYQGKIGTEPISGQGYCIEVTEQYAILLENGDFRRLDKTDMVLSRLLPRHTGRKFIYEHLTIDQISIDSLNLLVRGQLLAEVDLSSTQPFFVQHRGHLSEQKRYRQKYITNLHFLPISSREGTSPLGGTEGGQFPPFGEIEAGFNPRIPILQDQLQQLQLQNQRYRQQLRARDQDIELLKQQIRQAPDMATKEQRYRQLEALRTAKFSQPDLEKERSLAIEIAQLQKQAFLRAREQALKAAAKQENRKATPPWNGLSGHLTFVTII